MMQSDTNLNMHAKTIDSPEQNNSFCPQLTIIIIHDNSEAGSGEDISMWLFFLFFLMFDEL